MDKGRFEAFCTDAMLLIHEVVECAGSPPAERSEAEEDMLRQGRAVARALLVAIDQAAQPRAMPPHDPVFARAVQEVREAGVSDDLVGFVLEARNRHPLT
jgi:hypothetical protein